MNVAELRKLLAATNQFVKTGDGMNDIFDSLGALLTETMGQPVKVAIVINEEASK
jgi:hypothetical protein